MTECLRQELTYMETSIKITVNQINYNRTSIVKKYKNYFQSISPGLVESDIIVSGSDNEILKFMPRLKPEDVAKAVLFVISTPDHVQVCINFIYIFGIIIIDFY